MANPDDVARAGLGTDLSGADLSGADLSGADLGGADLYGANLCGANLHRADLCGADLCRANLYGADLRATNLSGAALIGADLIRANLSGANLSGVNLSEANLSEATLHGATLVYTNLEGAILTGCRIFGISAWKLSLKGATQTDLVISAEGEPMVTIDNLEVAQFIYLLLNNERVRDVINTLTTKVVLILGRFTPERKAVLDAIREELRRQNYVPLLFDFEKPVSRTYTETISTLAHLARFIIADITDPRSVIQELQAIVPELRVPVQAIIEEIQEPWGMFQDFPNTYPWVLAVHHYRNLDDLLFSLRDKVIGPAEAKAKELEGR